MAPKNRVWTEKYRPSTLSDVKYQDHVVSVLSRIISNKDTINKLPHFLFSGPAGTGKTSTANALCNDLFGKYKKQHVLELNASDDRGIAVIRSRVKDFAITKVVSKSSDGRQIPNFKIIILDEVDALTTDAQSALRRVMEDHAANTRFILCCNYASKLIDPITSRCSSFVFQSLPNEYIKDHLIKLASIESMEVPPQILDTIVKRADGDCRRAVSFLQVFSIIGANFDFCEICSLLPDNLAKEYFNKLRGASGNHVKDFIDEVVQAGYPIDQMLREFFTISIECDLPPKIKCQLLLELSNLAAQVEKGASEVLSMNYLFYLISTLPK